MIFAQNAPAEPAPAILESRQNGWRTLWKNDGTDYPALLMKFLAGEFKTEDIKKDYSTSVHLVEALGRRFIFKHYYKREQRPEKRLWHRLTGTFYERIFRLTNRAIQRGCRNVQEIFLVSDLFEGPHSKEVWLIAEYIQGEPLGRAAAKTRREDVFRTMIYIHQCGLASNDLHPLNLIVTPDDEIKLIDVSINSVVYISQVKDLISLRRHFGDEPPFKKMLLTGGVRYMLYWALRARYQIRRTLRRLQGKTEGGRPMTKN